MSQACTNRHPCPACKTADPKTVWTVREPDDFRIRRCGRCGLAYTVPSLDPQEMLAHYGEPYYGRRNVRFNVLFELLVGWFRRRRAAKICQLRARGRVLDVGCGRGHILACLRKRGWAVEGVELREAAVAHARDVLGLDVAVEGFDADRFPPERFDAVILWHVLEHLPDVSRALEGCARILKPGGLVAIAVPNIASWQARWTRYHWFHLDLPRHYSHFSEAWLRSRLERLGFTIREVSHFSFEQNPYGWIQSILNACGLRRNLLYDILKNPSARTVQSPLRRFPVHSVLSLVGFALLLPVACLVMIPECIFRRGATIELYAEKTAPQNS